MTARLLSLLGQMNAYLDKKLADFFDVDLTDVDDEQ